MEKDNIYKISCFVFHTNIILEEDSYRQSEGKQKLMLKELADRKRRTRMHAVYVCIFGVSNQNINALDTD